MINSPSSSTGCGSNSVDEDPRVRGLIGIVAYRVRNARHVLHDYQGNGAAVPLVPDERMPEQGVEDQR